jgi:hypothetical protein
MLFGQDIVGFISASRKPNRLMNKSWTGFELRLQISSNELLGPNRPSAAVMLPRVCSSTETKTITLLLRTAPWEPGPWILVVHEMRLILAIRPMMHATKGIMDSPMGLRPIPSLWSVLATYRLHLWSMAPRFLRVFPGSLCCSHSEYSGGC